MVVHGLAIAAVCVGALFARYASRDRAGSVAAPTAGLHFSDAILQQLRDKDVITSHMTLHVSAGAC